MLRKGAAHKQNRNGRLVLAQSKKTMQSLMRSFMSHVGGSIPGFKFKFQVQVQLNIRLHVGLCVLALGLSRCFFGHDNDK
jgi:hypothetical protein